MSRFLGGACCAVVALWGVTLFAQFDGLDGRGEGEAADPLARFEQRSEPVNAEERIESALNQQLKAPLDFTEVPLNEIINTLAEEYDIPIVFDKAALDEVAISPDTEVTVNLRSISLRKALNLMLNQPGIEDLTFIIRDEVLLITTQERADAWLLVRLYRIDDLEMYADPPREDTHGWVDFSPIIRVITSCVNRDSWQQNGKGDGDIILIRPGVLVVTQTSRIHDQIEQLLKDLRELKAEIESGTPPMVDPAAALAE